MEWHRRRNRQRARNAAEGWLLAIYDRPRISNATILRNTPIRVSTTPTVCWSGECTPWRSTPSHSPHRISSGRGGFDVPYKNGSSSSSAQAATGNSPQIWGRAQYSRQRCQITFVEKWIRRFEVILELVAWANVYEWCLGPRYFGARPFLFFSNRFSSKIHPI